MAATTASQSRCYPDLRSIVYLDHVQRLSLLCLICSLDLPIWMTSLVWDITRAMILKRCGE